MNVYSRFGGKDGVLDELFIDGFRRLAAHDGATRRAATTRWTTCGSAGPCYRQFAREQPHLLLADVRPRRARLRAVRRRPGGGPRRARPGRRPRRAGDGRRAAPRRRPVRRSPSALWAASTGWPRSSCERASEHGSRSTGTSSPRSPSTPCSAGSPRHRDPVRVRAPDATTVTLVALRRRRGRARPSGRCERDGEDWVGEVPAGTIYGLVADGDGPRFDPSKVLLDPRATEVWFPPGHDRQAARLPGVDNAGRGPLAVARPPRPPQAAAPLDAAAGRLRGPRPRAAPGERRSAGPARSPRSATSCRAWPRSGSPSSSCCRSTRTTRRRAATGGTCRWPSAPSTASTPPATTPPPSWPPSSPPPTSTTSRSGSTSCSTTRPRSTRTGPTYSLRGLSDGAYYRLRDDGSYIETTGCGNDLDATSPAAQDLDACGRSTASPTSASTASGSTSPPCSAPRPRSSPASTRGPRRGAW